MILITDDSKFMRHHLIQTLRKHGYTNFVEASNGREAILLYKLLKPNIVISDITMPEVDGLEALKEIMKMNSKAKVIMCSAVATTTNIEQAKALGASSFIVKPFFESLHEKVSQLKNKRREKKIEPVIF